LIEYEDGEARKGGMIRGWSSRGRHGPQERHSRACAGDRSHWRRLWLDATKAQKAPDNAGAFELLI